MSSIIVQTHVMLSDIVRFLCEMKCHCGKDDMAIFVKLNVVEKVLDSPRVVIAAPAVLVLTDSCVVTHVHGASVVT